MQQPIQNGSKELIIIMDELGNEAAPDSMWLNIALGHGREYDITMFLRNKRLHV